MRKRTSACTNACSICCPCTAKRSPLRKVSPRGGWRLRSYRCRGRAPSSTKASWRTATTPNRRGWACARKRCKTTARSARRPRTKWPRGCSATEIRISPSPTTGIAGPKSDDTKKPVGLCFIAVGDRAGLHIHKLNFAGDREEITETAKNTALFFALTHLRAGGSE